MACCSVANMVKITNYRYEMRSKKKPLGISRKNLPVQPISHSYADVKVTIFIFFSRLFIQIQLGRCYYSLKSRVGRPEHFSMQSVKPYIACKPDNQPKAIIDVKQIKPTKRHANSIIP